MSLYFRSSIKVKLTALIMATCAILLCIVGGVFLASELYSRQASIKKQNDIVATSLVAQVREPLVLESQSELKKILRTLDRQNNIHACYLFDFTGQPVAEYLVTHRNDVVLPALVRDFSQDQKLLRTQYIQKEGRLNFAHNYFSSFTPVTYEDKYIGTLYLLSDLDPFYDGIRSSLVGFVIAFILLIFFIFFLAGRMHKPVSAPLLDLAHLMSSITQSKDYSLRATKQTDDEIGILVDGFNRMLGHIEKHQQALDKNQQLLENAVIERTKELRDAVAKLEVARKQADDANQAKSDFLSRMTHELRTPLIGVLGMNELLMRTDLDDKQKMLVETVENSGQELLKLIVDVLDFSKIEANKLTLNNGHVDLFRLVEECVDLLTPQAFEKGIQLVVDIPLSATSVVEADKVRVRQILMNLIGNAIKFTHSGYVIVRLNNLHDGSDRGQFVLEVEDSGEGIDAQNMSSIFDVFYQVDGSDTRAKTGAGLGLSIVKQLVDLMQGEIEVDSSSSGGSLFRLFLPFPVVDKEVSFSIPDAYKNAQVLVCTPDNLFSRILVRNLHQLGMSLHYCRNIEEVSFVLTSMSESESMVDFFFIDTEMVTKEALNASIPQNLSPTSLNIFWLCYDRSRSVSSSANEQVLTLPISWDALMNALNSSSAQKSVNGLSAEIETKTTLSQAQHVPVLFSNNAASRELLRLGLRSVFSHVRGDRDLDPDRYACNSDSSKTSKKVFLFDVDNLDLADLQTFFQHSRQAYHILICKTSDVPVNKSEYDLLLVKPLADDDLLLLKRLLTDPAPGGLEEENNG